MEVLSPVKNFDVAKVVIQSGCDAIYLGSPNFSARNKVNIDNEQLEQIIDYANCYNIKSFVAFNTVIFEDEINDVLNEIVDVYNMGATGIIIQDFSLAKIIKENCPDLELHASTQMNVHNSNAVRLLLENGFNRTVVPREMTFARIKQLKKDTNIDIEAFIHGAICVSYSGQCYDSVLLDQKSANRGRCSQYCRFEQNVYKDGVQVNDLSYPLNIKDMNNHELIKQYEEAGVDSLKIEGRLKDIDYAGVTASNYSNNDIKYSLDQVYNRTFTNGLIDSTKTNLLVNNDRINNTGQYVGEVTKVEKNNTNLTYYKYIVTVSTKEINKGDNIRFILDDEEDGQVVDVVEENKIYSNCNVEIGSKVYKTSNISIYKYYNNLKNTYTRRNEINVKLKIKDNRATVEMLHNSYEFNVEYEQASKHSLTAQYLIENLTKTNNTPFKLNITSCDIPQNIYMSNKNIKLLKNKIIETLFDFHQVKRNSKYISYVSSRTFKKQDEPKYFIEVKTKEQLQISESYTNDIIISGLKLAAEVDIKDNYILLLPSVIYDDQLYLYEHLISKFKRLCVSELGMYYKYKDSHEIITNYTLNSTNSLNLNNLHASYNILSFELNIERINMCSNSNSVFILYGHIPVMTMDYCPINKNKQDGCNGCTLCHNNKYYLQDFKGRKFKLIHENIDKLCLYSEQPLFNKQHVDSLQLNNYLIRFTIESETETIEVLNSVFTDAKPTFTFEAKTLLKEVL